MLDVTVSEIASTAISYQKDVASLLWKAARTVHSTSDRIDLVWKVLDFLLSKYCVYNETSEPDWEWLCSFGTFCHA
jgi:hypothetical protein